MKIALDAPRTIPAKFAGTCRLCGGSYPAGTPIKNVNGAWIHGACAPSAPSKPKFEPSPYQQAVFDFVKNGSGHGFVMARAGSGKTTTILEALSFTKPSDKVAFVAFNSRIVKELERRAPAHVRVKTLHSLGFAAIRQAFGAVELDEYKLDKIFETIPDLAIGERRGEDRSVREARRAKMAQLVGLAMNTLVDIRSIPAILTMVDRYGIDLGGDEDIFLSHLARVIRIDLEMTNIVSFDDMVAMPIWLNLPVEQFDWLFVDEAQDLNAAQIEQILRAIKPGGRIVAVGDEQQSLYGFRGADTEAVRRIIKALNAKEMPLSITYRCPKAIVELAKTLVPDIEARPGAPEGEIKWISEDEFTPVLGDMVICRTNAPLVGPAFGLIRRGIKAVIQGRDIGAGLLKLSKKLGGSTIDEASKALEVYSGREMTKLMRRPHPESAIQALQDRTETLQAIYDQCSTVGEVEVKIRSIFSDDVVGVVFSSVHRAKGLEAETVYILAPEKLPLKRPGMQAWEIEQEQNCMYVAYTRAKTSLIFVETSND